MFSDLSVNSPSEFPIPEDPTMDMAPEEAARVRAELASAVRRAGDDWRPVVDAFLKRYGVWIDPREAECEREALERAAEAEKIAEECTADDSRFVTRGELRKLERTVAEIGRVTEAHGWNLLGLSGAVRSHSRDLDELADAVAPLLAGKGAR